MTIPFKTLVLLASLPLGLIALACGGGGGDGATADSPEAYARAFCDALGAHADDFVEMVGLAEELSNASSDDPASVLDKLVQMADLAAPTFRGLADDLGAIEPPEEISDLHQQMVTSFEDGAEALEGLEDISDQPLDQALDQLTTVQTEMDRFGQAFDTLADPPEEFQDAFDNEDSCQELQEQFSEL